MCNLCILRTNEDTDSVFQMYDSACIFRTSEDVRTSEDSDMKWSPKVEPFPDVSQGEAI